MAEKRRRLIINVVGFGMGLIWVAWDEIRNPKIFKIPVAGEFSVCELSEWNTVTGPKGRWAVDSDELERMKERWASPKETDKAEEVNTGRTW
jgi:hypothetical protein